jgi:multimeric flavodoxin WrbA
MHNNINESVERGDLKRLLHNELHIDQHRSKMGEDADIIVLSFKIKDKEPAADLVDFIEKGYDWVLDSDISSGELDDGDFLVFVEMERDTTAPDKIMRLIGDVNNLSDMKMSDWHWKYHKELKDYDMTEESLTAVLPLTQEEYKQKMDRKNNAHLDQLRTDAGVEVKTTAPVDEFTESLRIAAGIK